MLAFDMDFFWNGTQNLFVDICWGPTPDYDCSGRVRWYVDTLSAPGFERTDGTNVCDWDMDWYFVKPIVQLKRGNPSPNDIGVTAIDGIDGFCAGLQSIDVDVANFGFNQVSSFFLNWSVKGVLQTPASISGTLLDNLGGSGATELIYALGSYSFLFGSTYEISVWSTLPNGVADTVNINDTVSYIFTPGLSGVYTLGGLSPDFPDFDSADTALSSYGVCDSVIIKVRTGTYTEQFSLGDIPGSSANRYVVFESESGVITDVVIQHANTLWNENYIVQPMERLFSKEPAMYYSDN